MRPRSTVVKCDISHSDYMIINHLSYQEVDRMDVETSHDAARWPSLSLWRRFNSSVSLLCGFAETY